MSNHWFREAPPAARTAMALLWAFPLFAVSFRHWSSGIAIALFGLALLSTRKRWLPLGREESTFIGIIVAYVATAVISNTLSGWTPGSLRWFEAHGRFLFAIPLLVFLCRHPAAAMGLLRGIPVAGAIVGIHAIHLTFFAGVGRAYGPYGPIMFGDIAALLAALSVATIRFETYRQPLRVPLHITGAVMGLTAVALSGSRNAWLAAAITLPLALLFALRGMDRGHARRIATASAGAGLALVVLAAVAVPELTAQRWEHVRDQASSYSAMLLQGGQDSVSSNTVGIRVEQWRAGILMFRERPLFGYGIGNVGPEINRYVESGKVHPAIYVAGAEDGGPSHLHSAYFDALAYKGIIGLITLLSVLFYPAYLALQRQRRAPHAAGLVLVNSLAFAIFSLTEDPFIRNNFTSVYLVFTTAALALLLTEEGRGKPAK
jgi:O-antigen ligase